MYVDGIRMTSIQLVKRMEALLALIIPISDTQRMIAGYSSLLIE